MSAVVYVTYTARCNLCGWGLTDPNDDMVNTLARAHACADTPSSYYRGLDQMGLFDASDTPAD